MQRRQRYAGVWSLIMRKNPDWNLLISSYSAAREELPLDRRPDLWVCGYIPEGNLLSTLVKTPGSRILDYGCGNGRVSRYLSRRYGYQVTGVDVNPEAILRAESFEDGLSYHLIEPNRIPESLPPFDACVCNHVFPTFSSISQIRETLIAIRAALGNGAPLLVYVDNTNYTGIEYHSFIGGRPGEIYDSGDPFPMKIYLAKKIIMEFEDFFWKPDDYLRVIRSAGFSDVTVRYPAPDDYSIDTYEKYFGVSLQTSLDTEKRFPPAAIYCSVKAGDS